MIIKIYNYNNNDVLVKLIKNAESMPALSPKPTSLIKKFFFQFFNQNSKTKYLLNVKLASQ